MRGGVEAGRKVLSIAHRPVSIPFSLRAGSLQLLRESCHAMVSLSMDRPEVRSPAAKKGRGLWRP